MTAQAESSTRRETTGRLLGADSEESPVLTVVLPTKNEVAGVERTISEIRDAVASLGVTAEVIVSDSSTDDTAAVAEDLGAIVVEPDRMGYGYAYRYAFEHARGEYVAMGDADATYDFAELPRLYERLVTGDADIVIGSRFEGTIRDGAMPALHRYVGNPALTAFLNVFYDAGVTDAHSGFRVIRADALASLTLRSDGMEFASEMIMEASMRRLVIEEVPITYRERVGEATLDTFVDGWKHVRFMLLNAPGYLFSVPGLTAVAVGLVLMGLAFFDVEVTGLVGRPVWFGIRSMVAGSLLTIVGYQIASLGVFSSVAANPIRKATDPVTTSIVERFDLEAGLVVGTLLTVLGVAYAAWIVGIWLVSGYDALPGLTNDILAFTTIVLGIQTVFGSFFMSYLGTGTASGGPETTR